MKGKGTNGLTMADVQALRQGIAQAAANGAEALAAYDEMNAEQQSRYAELIAQLRDVT
ncbi:hypothetical protein HDR58_03390, partial [bacterium]|nr:hypothetical protein [bacterium]